MASGDDAAKPGRFRRLRSRKFLTYAIVGLAVVLFPEIVQLVGRWKQLRTDR